MASTSPQSAVTGVSSPGPGVDAQGRPVVDPTQNVLNVLAAAVGRQDDLRTSEQRHLERLTEVRMQYDRELREAEAKRIDAIRAVDVAAVGRAAEVSPGWWPPSAWLSA
jgi:hypothetical protein